MGGSDELTATLGGYLARINRHLATTKQDFMAIVDCYGDRPKRNDGRTQPVEGADINLIQTTEAPLIEADHSYRAWKTAPRIGVVAKLLNGDYPRSTHADTTLNIPRDQEVNANN